MVEVEQLVKCYGPTLALDGVSFTVEKGEVVGFLGPNGAGKTTAMRILTGYIPPTSGSATIAGRDAFRASIETRRLIGYLPEGVSLYPEMRVHEYLSYRAHIKGVPRRERKTRLGYVLDRCGIAGAKRKLISGLSKGFRQRVGLADALIHDPPVLILDEPTVGLDPAQIRQVRELIRDLGENRTILLSTHILPEVEMLCRRVLVISRGRLVFRDKISAIAGHEAGVTVELTAPTGAVVEALNGLPGIKRVTVEREGDFIRLRLQLAPDADPREEIARCAAERGWTVRELHLERPSLEEIFINLTAGEGA